MKKTGKPGDEAVKKHELVESKRNGDSGKIESVDIKNAHASGAGSLERSDENQIEKLNNGSMENDETSY